MRPRISPTFEEWLATQDVLARDPETNRPIIPLVRWGPEHSEIAERYAADIAKGAVARVLDEALNSGDGSYRP